MVGSEADTPLHDVSVEIDIARGRTRNVRGRPGDHEGCVMRPRYDIVELGSDDDVWNDAESLDLLGVLIGLGDEKRKCVGGSDPADQYRSRDGRRDLLGMDVLLEDELEGPLRVCRRTIHPVGDREELAAERLLAAAQNIEMNHSRL